MLQIPEHFATDRLNTPSASLHHVRSRRASNPPKPVASRAALGFSSQQYAFNYKSREYGGSESSPLIYCTVQPRSLHLHNKLSCC